MHKFSGRQRSSSEQTYGVLLQLAQTEESNCLVPVLNRNIAVPEQKEKNVRQSENDPEKQKSVVKQQMIMCKKNLKKKTLSIENLSKAVKELIKYSQRLTYPEEIKVWKQGNTHVRRNGSIFKLDTYKMVCSE